MLSTLKNFTGSNEIHFDSKSHVAFFVLAFKLFKIGWFQIQICYKQGQTFFSLISNYPWVQVKPNPFSTFSFFHFCFSFFILWYLHFFFNCFNRNRTSFLLFKGLLFVNEWNHWEVETKLEPCSHKWIPPKIKLIEHWCHGIIGLIGAHFFLFGWLFNSSWTFFPLSTWLNHF